MPRIFATLLLGATILGCRKPAPATTGPVARIEVVPKLEWDDEAEQLLADVSVVLYDAGGRPMAADGELEIVSNPPLVNASLVVHSSMFMDTDLPGHGSTVLALPSAAGGQAAGQGADALEGKTLMFEASFNKMVSAKSSAPVPPREPTPL